MGSFRNRVLIFAAVFLCLFLHFPSQTEAMSRAKSLKIMAQICKQTENIEVCLQVLLSRPQALFRYDLMAMAENAMQLSRKESNDTVNFFNNLANSKDTNPAFKLVLKNCISNFKEGFMFLNLDGLEGRTATFDMHNAYDKAFACETDLSANKIAIDLVLARIKKWKDVFSVAMAAAGVLEDSLPIPE
jgi:pectinesterase inhibitor-like protein